MLNTRHKIKKTQNTCFSQDSDQPSTAFNDDLLTEIFLRLPVTSIFRFKSVSKHWRWLLSHRHFTLRYDKLLKSPGLFAGNKYVPFVVENRNSIPPPFRCLNFVNDHNDKKILQSCNGLLLCRSRGQPIRRRRYYVINPTTKKLANIPSVPGGREVRKSICFMGLAFHPTHCVSYKVVCVRRLTPNGKLFQIQTYSSDTGRWKISVESFVADWYFTTNGVYCNGAIHWYPSRRNHLYFKVEAEELQALPLPVQVASSEGCWFHDKDIPMYFGESRGHLHLVTRNPLMNDLRLNVYELSSDHSGWFVKCEVEFDELADAFPEMRNQSPYRFRVIDVVRGEREEETFMVVRIPGKIIRYNVHYRSFKHISSFAAHMNGLLAYYRYTETLSPF